MRLSKPAAWFLFLLFIFVVTYVVVQREAVTDERVARGGGSANSVTIVSLDSETPFSVFKIYLFNYISVLVF